MARNRTKTEDDVPKKSAKQKLASVLEVPFAALNDCPHIELFGNLELTIDGCRGILEYEDDSIRLNLGKNALRVTGRNLSLKALTDQTAVIEGYILLLEFLS